MLLPLGAIAEGQVRARPEPPVGRPASLVKPLPAAPPASEGFAADRLQRLHDRVRQFVDDGLVAGFVTLIARHGRIVDVHASGLRDREQRLPMTRDTIFRIYSMSKLVTSVAVLALLEEGRLRLDDPIAQYLPMLAKRQVFIGGTAEAPQLASAARPITIRHLLTHTSGFAYGLAQSPVDDLYRKAALLSAPTTDEFLVRAATLPLIAQPGERFYYGINTDLLGAIVERVTGESLEQFLQSRILQPLGMRDTSFSVPAAKRPRMAKVYARAKDDALTPLPQPLAPVVPPGVPYPDEEGRLFMSGGGGLFSTVDDYARFGQMLLNGGELEGARILGRKTVEAMRSNHLRHLAPPPVGTPPSGFGLGVSVRLDLASGVLLGSPGQCGWTGAATTYVNLDPEEQTLAMIFAQHMPHNEHDVFGAFSTLMYAALVDSAAAARP